MARATSEPQIGFELTTMENLFQWKAFSRLITLFETCEHVTSFGNNPLSWALIRELPWKPALRFEQRCEMYFCLRQLDRSISREYKKVTIVYMCSKSQKRNSNCVLNNKCNLCNWALKLCSVICIQESKFIWLLVCCTFFYDNWQINCESIFQARAFFVNCDKIVFHK